MLLLLLILLPHAPVPSGLLQSMLWLYKLPYKIGLFTAVTAGIVSIPLVFDLETAIWFNDTYVTAEAAGEGETDTWLEVGSWTWNWMEPVSLVQNLGFTFGLA